MENKETMMNEIVAAVSHQGVVYIFMRDGEVFEMRVDSMWGVKFRLIHHFNPPR